jgi:hypothetical protein
MGIDVGGYLQRLEALKETDSAASSAASSAGVSAVNSPQGSDRCMETHKSSLDLSNCKKNEDGGGGGPEVINGEEEGEEGKVNGQRSVLQLQMSELDVAKHANGGRKDRVAPLVESPEDAKERGDKAEAKKKRKKERDVASSNLLAQAAAMMTAQSSLKYVFYAVNVNVLLLKNSFEQFAILCCH